MATTHAAATTHRHAHVGTPARPLGALARLTARLLWRGTLAIGVGLGALIVLEGLSFETAYPDAASRQALVRWAEDPSVRIIAGPGSGVDTVGGFALWDAGLYLMLITAAWALTAATRILRADEDAGRIDPVLGVAPARARAALAVQLAMLIAAALVVGALVAVSFLLIGAEPEGSWLAGLTVAGYAAVLIATAGAVSQVFGTRRLALTVSGGVIVGWILLRLTANSTDDRAWLGWFTPAGWFDRIEAFDVDRWSVLLVPLGATLVLGAAAVLLRGIRDTGAGLVRARTSGRTRRWGLGGVAAFAWRTNQGVLLAWAAGLAATGLVMGTLLPVVDEFLEDDPGFLDLLTAFGMSAEDLLLGFLAMISVIFALVIAVYAAFRMGATRVEEASTRAEFLLTRPVARWRWLGAHVLTLLAAVVVLATVAAASMLLGSVIADAGVGAADAFSAMANALPPVVVFVGLAVLVFGIAPRATVPVAAGAAVVAYLIELVGPLLEWPEWVLAVSPFHHLAQVPVDPVDLPAAAVMTAVGVVLGVVGLLAFERRDVVGA